MNYLISNSAVLVHAIGWTILHSLWQGLMLFCLLKIVLRFIPEAKAKLRYNISLTVLSALTIWVISTFYNQWQNASYTITTTINNITLNNIDQFNALYIDQTAAPSTISSLLLWFDQHTNSIVTIYTIGICVLAMRLLYNLFSINQLKRNSKYNNNIQWNNILYKHINRLGIKRRVDLMTSKHINTPIVVGVIKPVILFPIATINHLSTEQFEAILIHELAHIRRYDYLVNIIQVVLETILFYNPFVWLISKTIRTEREHCCDDVVTNNANKVPYANALAQLAAYAHNANTAALAATGNKHQLLHRIKRIIEMKNSPITRTQITAIIVLIISMILSITLITPKLTAKTKDDKKEQTNKKDDKEKDKKKKKKLKKVKVIEMTTEDVTVVDENGNKHRYTKTEDISQADRARLHKAFGDYDVYYGPKKKFIMKTGDSFQVKAIAFSDDDDVTIDIDAKEIDELGEELGKNISKTVLVALNEINWDELGEGLGEALKGIEISMESTGDALDATGDALNSINWGDLKIELKEALDEIDTNKLKDAHKKMVIAKVASAKAMAEARANMKDAKKEMIINRYTTRTEVEKDMDKARKKIIIERHRVHDETMKKHNNALAKHKIVMEKHKDALAKHKIVMEKHHKSMAEHDKHMSRNSEYEKMLMMMEKDGLINRNKSYVVEKKGKRDLYIDGIKQSDEVYNKYKDYLNFDEVTIEGNKNSLSVSTTDRK